MPRKPTDYSQTIIYKIVCKDLSIPNVFVGHTTNFTNRKCYHKSIATTKNESKYQGYLYEFIKNNGGWDNWEMLEVEKFKCCDGNEARARERYWAENLKATLNQKD